MKLSQFGIVTNVPRKREHISEDKRSRSEFLEIVLYDTMRATLRVYPRCKIFLKFIKPAFSFLFIRKDFLWHFGFF